MVLSSSMDDYDVEDTLDYFQEEIQTLHHLETRFIKRVVIRPEWWWCNDEDARIREALKDLQPIKNIIVELMMKLKTNNKDWKKQEGRDEVDISKAAIPQDEVE